MWTLLTTGYMVGLIATIVALKRDRSVGAGPAVDAAWSVLWPLYWGLLGILTYRNRRRPGSG